MTQIYSKETSERKMQPKKGTIQFLLNYSKSYKVIKSEGQNVLIELNLN